MASVLPVLLTGCPGGGKKADLVGWVRDTSDNDLPLVKVTVAGADETYTDGSGLFMYKSLAAASNVTVSFSLEGYAPESRDISLPGGKTTTLNVTLKRLNSAKTLADAAGGGQVNDGKGNSVFIGAGVLSNGSKAGVSGSAQVQITALDTSSEYDSGAFPGGLQAKVTGEANPVLLDVFAVVHFQAMQNGNALMLQTGGTARIRIKLPADTPLQAGDTVTMWRFDIHSGLWVAGGVGTVEASGGGGLVVVADVGFFGWWCCAAAIPSPHIIRGHVYGADSAPVDNALIIAHGADYHGVSLARSGDDGAYSIRVKPDSLVRVDLVLPGAYYVCDSVQTNSGAAGTYTDGVDLSPDFKSCIQGHVTREDGTTPVSGATVYSSTGGIATTSGDGLFCMPAPADTYVAVYVIGRPPVVVRTPSTATCEGGNCADVTISVYYPEDGDRVGLVFSTLTTSNGIFGERKDLGSMGLFYAGFKGEQFDPFDPDAPQDTCRVYTRQIDASFDLGVYLGLLSDTLAFNLVFNMGVGINEMMDIKCDEVPTVEKIGALDAGSPGNVTNGTTTVAMERPLDYYYDFTGTGSLEDLGYAFLEPWMGGFFMQRGFLSTGFDNGNTLTYSWPGGVDLGPFSVTETIPGRLTITAPTSLSGLFSETTLLEGLPVTWDTNGAGDYVTLLIETVVLDSLVSPLRFGAIACKAADDGSFTIPASALAQLPQPSGGITLQVNYLFAKRHAVAEADVPLVRGGGNGYVVLITGTEPVRKWGLDAHISIPKEGEGE